MLKHRGSISPTISNSELSTEVEYLTFNRRLEFYLRIILKRRLLKAAESKLVQFED